MRTISKRTQYGLKAVIALGRRYGEGPVLIATLSAEETIPLKFLEGILLDLKGRIDGDTLTATTSSTSSHGDCSYAMTMTKRDLAKAQ